MSRPHKKPFRVARGSSAGPLCSKVEIADTFRMRLIGLLGRKQLSSDEGIWLHPSRGIHTFGMRFPIDVIALDCEMKVVGLYRELHAWKIAATSAGTHSVLELPSGRIETSQIGLGETVFLEAHSEKTEGEAVRLTTSGQRV